MAKVIIDKIEELECEAFYDFKRDTIYVKVRRLYKDKNGNQFPNFMT